MVITDKFSLHQQLSELYRQYRGTKTIESKADFFSPECHQICRTEPSYAAQDRDTIVRYLLESGEVLARIYKEAGWNDDESNGASLPPRSFYTMRPLTDAEASDFGTIKVLEPAGLSSLEEVKARAKAEDWAGLRVNMWTQDGRSRGILVKVQYWWRKEPSGSAGYWQSSSMWKAIMIVVWTTSNAPASTVVAGGQHVRKGGTKELTAQTTSKETACAAGMRNLPSSVMEDGRPEKREEMQQYQQTRERESMYHELFELLRTMSSQDSAEALRRLRAGMDAASILRHVKNGHLLIQLSLAAETRRLRYEFPYVSGMPRHLLKRGNVYLDSLLYHATLPSMSSQSSSHRGADEERRGFSIRSLCHTEQPIHQDDANSSRFPITYLMPYSTGYIVEPLIDKLKAKPWTRVISDDGLLRKLISSYFYYPHPSGPFINKDLFLQDMAEGQHRFCSPLLVNAVLLIASQSYLGVPDRSKIWHLDSLPYKLMAEARRLWDIDSFKKASIPTIQAALTLSFTSANNGLSPVDAMYAKRACEMCQELDLFGPERAGEDAEMRKARVFTAWCVYSWQASFHFSFFTSPFFDKPPETPLPSAKLEPEWYGEVWIQYPHNPTLNSLHIGHKMQAELELRAIMNGIALKLFGKPSERSLSVDEIIKFKNKIDTWLSTLPEPLQPRNLIFPLHLALHVQYHQLVITFMQYVTDSNHIDDPRLLEAFARKRPISLLNEAKSMLETVMRLYYLRHNFEIYDPWVAFGLIAVGNGVIADLASDSGSEPKNVAGYRSTLILAAQGLSFQGLNYHISRLLSIQLLKAMEPQDLQLVQTHVKPVYLQEDEETMVAEHSNSMWPVPGIAIMNEDPEKKRLMNLVARVGSVDLNG
ncbi:hypothetical protein FGRMN_5671 [Fusarium graminum]|nr:hypothetical protein FGRMN_5671 [Fusarium graminum]